MEIRRAVREDLEGINNLLCQVLELHHKGRPDLFYGGVKKYSDEELYAILEDDTRPIPSRCTSQLYFWLLCDFPSQL